MSNYLIQQYQKRKSQEDSTRRFRDRLNQQFEDRTKFLSPIVDMSREMMKVRKSKVTTPESLVHVTNTKTKN